MMEWINKIIQGDALEVVKQLPEKSVNCVITSPPYWQLRSYGWSGQWGLESTFNEYLEHLWSLMDEIYRVLRDDGCVFINLGDTYGTKSSNMTEGNIVPNKIAYTGGIENYNKPDVMNKCLLLIPHRFAMGCIDRGWIVRNNIIWAKKNGMPESVTDRFSKKHEFVFFMVKNKDYYFDLEGIKDKTFTCDGIIRDRDTTKLNNTPGRSRMSGLKENNYSTKNPGDVSDFWDIPTQPSNEKHFAMYNTKLIDKPIIAGCPEYVCSKCGKPREKIIEKTDADIQRPRVFGKTGNYRRNDTGLIYKEKRSIVTGFTDCGCGVDFVGGIVMDPFCGTGTSLYRAVELGRRYIGIDGKAEYCEIARKNLKRVESQLRIF